MKEATIKLNNGFKAYPAYKDSGIEWIGKIPAGWRIETFKYLTSFISRGESPDYVDESEVKIINQACIYWDKLRLQKVKYDSQKDSKNRKGRIRKDDLLMNSTGTGTLGRLAIFKEERGNYIADSHVTIIRTRQNTLNPLFLKYLFQTDIFQGYIFASSVSGSTNQIELSRERLKVVPIILPEIEKQCIIADYLDEKTELIDKIIEKKKRLIELLREKRAAMINQAVTKGLDPNVELVDSGIERIGKVPKGWEIRKLKYASNVQASNVDKNTNPELPEVLLCNYVDVYKNEYIDQSLSFMRSTATREQIQKVGLKKGDVLLTKDSETADDIGIPAVINENIPHLVLGYHLYVVRPKQDLLEGEFLFRYLQSQYVRSQFELSSNGITRFGLGSMAVKNLLMLLPGPEEQRRIINYTSEKAQLIDDILATTNKSIELLKEFKSSLISNVVTGKIRV